MNAFKERPRNEWQIQVDSGKIDIEKDVKEARKILRDLQRTDDTGGAYNPYNLARWYIAKTVHETLEDLKVRVHVCKPERILVTEAQK